MVKIEQHGLSGRKILLCLLLCILAGISLLLSSRVLGEDLQLEIELLPAAEAGGLYIELGEIALLRGDSDLVARLQEVKVGSIPRPGYTSYLGAGQIKYKLRRAGFSPDDFVFRGAARTEVTGDYREITSGQLQEFLLPWIKDELCFFFGVERFEDFPPETEIVIKPAGLNNGGLLVPAGDVYLEPESVNSGRPWGKKNIGFTVYVEGEEYKTIYRTFDIRFYLPVYSLKEDVSRGQLLSKALLVREKRELSHLLEPPLLKLEEITGKKAKRMLPRGEIITPGLLVIPPLVERGQMVKMIVRYKALQIQITVEALEDGFLNETIRVRNNRSGKVVQATVMGPAFVYKELK